MTEAPKRADPELVKALAREASAMLDDRVFTTAVRALHAQWYGELIAAGSEPTKVLELVAKLRALEAIPQMLKHFVDSATIQQRGSDARRN
jgi:hypothetical protein